jgi:hypothetical protein
MRNLRNKGYNEKSGGGKDMLLLFLHGEKIVFEQEHAAMEREREWSGDPTQQT